MRAMVSNHNTPKKVVVITHSKNDEIIGANILDKQFSVDQPKALWVGDISHLRAGGKWHTIVLFSQICFPELLFAGI